VLKHPRFVAAFANGRRVLVVGEAGAAAALEQVLGREATTVSAGCTANNSRRSWSKCPASAAAASAVAARTDSGPRNERIRYSTASDPAATSQRSRPPRSPRTRDSTDTGDPRTRRAAAARPRSDQYTAFRRMTRRRGLRGARVHRAIVPAARRSDPPLPSRPHDAASASGADAFPTVSSPRSTRTGSLADAVSGRAVTTV
jgi:hypothetical protein